MGQAEDQSLQHHCKIAPSCKREKLFLEIATKDDLFAKTSRHRNDDPEARFRDPLREEWLGGLRFHETVAGDLLKRREDDGYDSPEDQCDTDVAKHIDRPCPLSSN